MRRNLGRSRRERTRETKSNRAMDRPCRNVDHHHGMDDCQSRRVQTEMTGGARSHARPPVASRDFRFELVTQR